MSPAAPAIASTLSPCDEQLQATLTEIHTMVCFLRREGRVIPDGVRLSIADVCADKEIPASEANADSTMKGAETKRVSIDTALSVHGSLCQLVAPATPVTIRASQVVEGRIVSNPIVRFLLRATLGSLVIFVVVTLLQEFAPKFWAGANWVVAADGLFSTLILLAAAGMGSGFFGLYTAHKFITRSTFDPKYAQTYFVRFFLGLTSGVILGYFGKNLLGAQDPASLKLLGPPVLALLGGYASEAVSQILSRVADTLVTLVRGGGADILQAKEEEMKAKGKQREAQIKGNVEGPLREIDALLTAPDANQTQIKAIIERAMEKLKQ